MPTMPLVRMFARTTIPFLTKGRRHYPNHANRFFVSSSSSSSSAQTTRANLRRTTSSPPPPSNQIPFYLYMILGVPVVGGAYLYNRYLEEVPLTHRKRWIATSSTWERTMGDDQYKALLRQFRKDTLPPDHRASITVRRVGNRIYKAAQEFHNEHSSSNNNTPWNASPPTFTVVRTEMANAFVLPNNHIFVMTGLFRYVRDEDDLAAVLGHEMAHNLARHVGEKASESVVVAVLARLTLWLDPSGVLAGFFVPTASLLRELPHSRIQELEADRIGMHLAAMACYDPLAAKRVFQRMADESKNAPLEFMSTHPSNDSRIGMMDEWLPETKRIFGRSGRCEHVREEMALARKVAAQQAAERERRR